MAVYIEQLQGRHSKHIESRVAKCSVEQVGPAEYRVKEGESDKRVSLGLLGDRGIAVCKDFKTTKPCEANKNEMPCCHCVAAYRDFENSVKGKAA